MRNGLRDTLLGRALAAAAVVAVAAGCSAQTTGTPDAKGVRSAKSAKPSSGTAGSSTAAASPSPSRSGAKTAPVAGTPAASATTAPAKQPVDAATPRTLMSRGSNGKQVRELQARLRQIGWFDETPTGTYGPVTVASVQGFQAKRGLAATGRTDTVTWQKLLAMTRTPTRDELNGTAGGQQRGKLDPRCMTGRVMCISKTSRTLSWVDDGHVLSTMDVRFGSQYTPTREGTFHVDFKSRHHVSTIYHTAMPYAMFFSGGQAVHYSSDFAARGYNGASHGCVNVRDEGKIAALFAQVKVGDKVVVYW
ncbi:L,D-transpeptidase family protein [Streptomyces sp. NPDC051322]|uniref:L,D-transpeptidase family protein n=1 Tax=Streptomyces sp. NPDC051322 TaxID=3154645 RepID=UPI00344F8019